MSSSMFKKHPTPLLIQLVGLTVMLFFCSTCVADKTVIFKSAPGSYDDAQAACANVGGGLVEVRTQAIYNDYLKLIKDAKPFMKDVRVFLGGSRDNCGVTTAEISNCEWCWRADWRQDCFPWDIFYRSALRPWGRPIPGMFVKFANPYPAGPRTQLFVAHVYSWYGWVDAGYESRSGMTHTLCYIKDPTETPPVTEDNTQFSGSTNPRGWWDEQVVAPNRSKVKNNWWIIMAVCFIAGGSAISGLYYFVVASHAEKDAEEFEEFGTDVDDEGHSEEAQIEMESFVSVH